MVFRILPLNLESKVKQFCSITPPILRKKNTAVGSWGKEPNTWWKAGFVAKWHCHQVAVG